MNFVARLTADAMVKTLKDDRKVVTFSVALNDFYKPKGKEQAVKVTSFVNCSYWVTSAIADRLKKGTLVEIGGRIHVNAYKSFDGEARASLNCHVNSIKVHQQMKDTETKTANVKVEVTEDLPF